MRRRRNKKALALKGYYWDRRLPEVDRCYYSTGRRAGCRVIDLLKGGEPRWTGVMYYSIPEDSEFFIDNPTRFIDEK